MRNLQKLQKVGQILGLMNIAFEKDSPCGACQTGKQVGAQYYAKNIMIITRSLEMLHIDLFRPIALVVTNIVLLLLMIILASRECSFYKIKVKLKKC
jgi:hypothetical protein